jgi:hypothetical protein
MKLPHFLLPVFAATALCITLGTGCGAKPSQAQVIDMFQKAGGIEVVNRESAQLFQRFGTNDSRVIYGSELTNYPKLSSIGKTLFLQMSTSDSSARIEIPIGSHWGRTFIIIFDPDKPFRFQYQAEFFQVSSNIFLGK